ncbi:MAG: leucine--tRNA ligase [Opitutales bacterium]|nr:leucine--tRNA ligase [Opitutales bacterium]
MAENQKIYDFTSIEKKWQEYWEREKTFRAEDNSEKAKYYALDMFPYPSGAGLHIGHPEGYVASDILARYKKACGFNVLHPMGWDAFGLPAEQYAIKTGTHPSVTTRENVDNFRLQIKSIGFAIDWDREINTTDSIYYKWTQWIFLKLFQRGLAYVDEKPVWWCPNLRAVLANEEVVDGKSEVGNHPVERRNLRQVVLRITAYAEKLLEGLDDLDWPDSTKRQQKAWIGKSEGAQVQFEIAGLDEKLEVYTTRPDTLFGATYMVVAPEHPLLKKLVISEKENDVQTYVEAATKKSDLDRTDLAKDKSGVFTGSYCINPVNGEQIPVWVADYVLISYGTGAIMAVPGHDERDHEFAEKYQIEIRRVIGSQDGDEEKSKLPYSGPGVMVNSGEYDGMEAIACKSKIISDLEEKGVGKGAINYKLRDWIFSRQRYWGEPIPLVWVRKEDFENVKNTKGIVKESLPHDPVTSDKDGETLYALPVPSSELPLKLPEVENYQPAGTGESPLATISEWLDIWFNLETGQSVSRNQSKPDGDYWVSATRETNTMPQWAGSCWYHLRYLDPQNEDQLVDPTKESYWGSPDFYIGGAEHAVLHLLYARFWHRFLHDEGVLKNPEPYKKLFHQGLILGEDGNKMSKSVGNVVSPDVVIDAYGADSLRLFEMFLGPLEAVKPWSEKGIEGVHRFLKKVHRECLQTEKHLQDEESNKETLKVLHETILKVTEAIEDLRFNVAISQMMILINQLQKVESYSKESIKILIQLLAPFAPHLSEELWESLGGKPSIANEPWPQARKELLVSDEITIVFQVNGKLRGEGQFPKDVDKDSVISAAKADAKVQSFLEGKEIMKEIYVPGKLVNLAVKG